MANNLLDNIQFLSSSVANIEYTPHSMIKYRIFINSFYMSVESGTEQHVSGLEIFVRAQLQEALVTASGIVAVLLELAKVDSFDRFEIRIQEWISSRVLETMWVGQEVMIRERYSSVGVGRDTNTGEVYAYIKPGQEAVTLTLSEPVVVRKAMLRVGSTQGGGPESKKLRPFFVASMPDGSPNSIGAIYAVIPGTIIELRTSVSRTRETSLESLRGGFIAACGIVAGVTVDKIFGIHLPENIRALTSYGPMVAGLLILAGMVVFDKIKPRFENFETEIGVRNIYYIMNHINTILGSFGLGAFFSQGGW